MHIKCNNCSYANSMSKQIEHYSLKLIIIRSFSWEDRWWGIKGVGFGRWEDASSTDMSAHEKRMKTGLWAASKTSASASGRARSHASVRRSSVRALPSWRLRGRWVEPDRTACACQWWKLFRPSSHESGARSAPSATASLVRFVSDFG